MEPKSHELPAETRVINLETILQNMRETAQAIRLGKRQYWPSDVKLFEAAHFRYMLLEPTHPVVIKYPDHNSMTRDYLTIVKYYRSIRRSRKHSISH